MHLMCQNEFEFMIEKLHQRMGIGRNDHHGSIRIPEVPSSVIVTEFFFFFFVKFCNPSRHILKWYHKIGYILCISTSLTNHPPSRPRTYAIEKASLTQTAAWL
jgi:hypothetical protein